MYVYFTIGNVFANVRKDYRNLLMLSINKEDSFHLLPVYIYKNILCNMLLKQLVYCSLKFSCSEIKRELRLQYCYIMLVFSTCWCKI